MMIVDVKDRNPIGASLTIGCRNDGRVVQITIAAALVGHGMVSRGATKRKDDLFTTRNEFQAREGNSGRGTDSRPATFHDRCRNIERKTSEKPVRTVRDVLPQAGHGKRDGAGVGFVKPGLGPVFPNTDQEIDVFTRVDTEQVRILEYLWRDDITKLCQADPTQYEIHALWFFEGTHQLVIKYFLGPRVKSMILRINGLHSPTYLSSDNAPKSFGRFPKRPIRPKIITFTTMKSTATEAITGV